jgi:hypothetical protein
MRIRAYPRIVCDSCLFCARSIAITSSNGSFLYISTEVSRGNRGCTHYITTHFSRGTRRQMPRRYVGRGGPYTTLSEFCSLDSRSSLYCPSYITIDLQTSLDYSHCNLSEVDQINGEKEGPCNFSLSRRSDISSHN